MNPDINPKLHLDERLNKAVCQTRGLLYALAALAARPPDGDIVDEPTHEPAHGLVWLAADLGYELATVADELSDEWRAMNRAAAGEQKSMGKSKRSVA